MLRPLSLIFQCAFCPFQDYFSSYETGQLAGDAKTREPREKTPSTLASRTWHVLQVPPGGLKPTPDIPIGAVLMH